MTRQNVTDGPREILTRKCPTCGGDGIVVSDQTAAVDLERRLRQLVAGSRSQAYRVEVPARAAAVLIGPGAERLAELEARTKRRFFLVPKEGVAADHLVVLGEGKLADLAPGSPVEEGAEVELKLVEVDRHDPDAGVGKLDGLDVCVAHAAKLVGKKVKARVERVLDGSAYATLLAPRQAAPEPPITAEREAEKPTRKPPARKGAKAAEPAAAEPAEEPAAAEATEEPAAVEPEPAEEEDEEAAPAAETADGTPPKKRTRRGSRGGRRRKKPAVAENGGAAAGEGDGAEPAAAAPRIHVPGADLGESEAEAPDEAPAAEAAEAPEAEGAAAENGDGPAAPRKRTRRGTRGGRNRRKRTEDGAAPAEDGDEVEPVGAAGSGAGPAPAGDESAPDREGSGYVPMSEWIDELEP